MILDGTSLYGGMSFQAFHASPEYRGLMLKRKHPIPPLAKVAEGAPLQAWVQQGHLVVSCPDCTASGRTDAELGAVWLAGPHLFLCAVCGNASVGRLWRRVALPPDLEVIDRLLSMRENQGQRTWLPGETLDNLRAENRLLLTAARAELESGVTA